MVVIVTFPRVSLKTWLALGFIAVWAAFFLAPLI